MNQSNIVMVGTKKGAFVFESKDGRRSWRSTGPHFKGTQVFHVTRDPRSKVIFAAVDNFVWGPTVARSTDLGRTWKESEKPPKFPKGSGLSVGKVWHIQPANEDEPDVMYCGTDPAALFTSMDGGDTWSLNQGLFKHKTRPKWQAGFGGLCLHSILVDPRDPDTLIIAISSVGVVKSTDGGRTWAFRNKNVLADFLPPGHQFPEYGQCTHHLVRTPSRPDVIYHQNHAGVYRSDDNAENWVDISEGLPSRFGFGIAVDFNDPKRVYVAPEESGAARLPPNGRFLVWGSDDAGKSWSPLSSGLPRHSFYNVLREGMASDMEDPCGVYFGTTTGQLYGSRNGGKRWELIADGLPPIYSVSTGSGP
jgi:photosystem II stability/assembly factor-like uncharacterized protein